MKTEIPCSCSECMESLAKTGKALIFKSDIGVGSIVKYSKEGLSYLHDDENERKKASFKLMTVVEVFEDDGLLLFKTDSDSAHFVESELILIA